MKIFAVSLGCAKNSVDTEQLLGALDACSGPVEFTDDLRQADLLLVNTCGFIESAVQESVDTILQMAQQRKRGQLLAVTGCLVQRYGDELKQELAGDVDLFCGTAISEAQDVSWARDFAEKICRMLSRAGDSEHLGGQAEHRGRAPLPLLSCGRLVTTPSWRAYVKIAEGCSNRCTYCLIPQIRGPVRCRPVKEIVREVQELSGDGTREVTLLAQDLSSYHHGGTDLAGLIQSILSDTDIEWLRLLYLYPTGITRRLLETLAGSGDRICRYLDMPVQHASSEILRRMGRGYGAGELEMLFKNVREALPDFALRTTVITGFPGETESHFSELVDFVQKWRFMHLGCFAYSDEEGCAAAGLGGKVEREVAQQRRDMLMDLQAGISREINRELVGSTHMVLVEGVSAETELLLQGRTCFQAPDVDGVTYIASGEADAGEIVPVEVVDSHVYDLVGHITETGTSGEHQSM